MKFFKCFFQCISAICAIELPRKEWPDLINNLVANTSNTHTEYRMAAILTLGFICEALVIINIYVKIQNIK